MAWNPPADFATDEVVTETKLDQIRESLLYLKGQAGAIVPEAVIAPVRNDGSYMYTLERTSVQPRKYGLAITAAGEFVIDDLTSTQRRLTIDTNGNVTSVGALFTTSGGAYINGAVSTGLESFVVAQGSFKALNVAATGITGTQNLVASLARGATGFCAAYGSVTGYVGTQFTGTSGTLASFGAGAFLLEISGTTLRARRASGSETWAIGVWAIVN